MQPFEVSLPINGIYGDHSVLYLYENSYSERDLIFTIRNILNVRNPPDNIFIICPVGTESHIANTFQEYCSTVEENLFVVSSITVLPFGVKGELIQDSIEKLHGDLEGIADEHLDVIAQECIKWALPKTKAIFNAPHGYQFQKPSRRLEDFFVRAGNMLLYQDLLLVFCQLILRRIPEKTEVIFIDSFTIYSFVLGLQSLLGYFSRQSNKNNVVVPIVENFHSYEIGPKFRLPNNSNYFVIISASTTGNLREKLIKDYSAENSRIIHLLGVGQSGGCLQDSSIFFEERKAVNDYFQGSKIIGINTEEFMVSHGNVIPVRITKRHVLKEQTDILQEDYYRDTLQLRKVGTLFGYGPHSMFSIKSDLDITWPKAFSNWLQCQLVHEIPATVKTIIHMDDCESKKIGEKIQKHLHCELGITQVSLVSSDNCDDQKISSFPKNSTVLVVANEDPNLELFGAISIRLRTNPNIFRHYILAYAFPDSNEQFQRRVNELRLAPGSQPKFGWSNFRVIPVGPIESHEAIRTDYGIDWIESEELGKNVGKDIFESRRLQVSGGEVEQSSEIFFPSLSGNKLALRHGSIFFSNKNNSENVQTQVSQKVVYLVVSSALQQARECVNNPELQSGFDENPYIKSVIDPMMFMRFNDGIIQAALLRALSKSEIDFSSSDDLSARFRQVVIHIVNNSDNTAGEAVLEFLAAVARNKVGLTCSDFDKIQDAVIESEKLKLYWQFFRRKFPI